MFSWKRDLFVEQRLIVHDSPDRASAGTRTQVTWGTWAMWKSCLFITELNRVDVKWSVWWSDPERRERVGESCEITRCDLNIHSKYKYCMTSQLCSESAWSLPLSKTKALDGHWGFFLLLGQVVWLFAMNCPGTTSYVLDTSFCRWYGVQGMSDYHDNH